MNNAALDEEDSDVKNERLRIHGNVDDLKNDILIFR